MPSSAFIRARPRPVFGLVVLLLIIGALATATPAFAEGGPGDRFIMGEKFVLAEGETLSGNLAVLGGSARLAADSVVAGDVALLGGDFYLAGDVKGDVAILGGAGEIAPGARIEGDLAVFGGDVIIAEDAQLLGERFSGLTGSFRLPRLPAWVRPAFDEPVDQPGWSLPGVLRDLLRWQAETLGWLVALVLLGVVLAALAPKRLERIAAAAAAQPAFNFGLGLLSLLLALLTGTLLLIACGLGLLVWLALFVTFGLGWIAVGLWVGRRLLTGFGAHGSLLVEVAAGVALITLFSRIPFFCLGGLFALILGSIGLGAVAQTRLGSLHPAASAALLPVPGRVVDDDDLE